jgi:hypothetical protein
MQKVSRLIRYPMVYLLCTVLIVVFGSPVSAASDQVSINELMNNSAFYDDKIIVLTGEAIGECLERENGCWINMSDGGNAIGIWMTESDAARIRIYGDYRHTGDKVTVTGIFYEACAEHGGEPDIHCTELTIDHIGAERSQVISKEKGLTAICVVAIALVLCLTYQKKVLLTGK